MDVLLVAIRISDISFSCQLQRQKVSDRVQKKKEENEAKMALNSVAETRRIKSFEKEMRPRFNLL